jgi:hypothetical protein
MEVTPLPPSSAENWTEQFAAALHAQRQRVREFLVAQQDRLRRSETELSEQLQRIASELAEDRLQTSRTQEELDHRSDQVQHQAEALEQMKTDLAARQDEWERLYRRVTEQQQLFADQFKLQQDEFAHRQQDILQRQSATVAAETQLLNERKKIEDGRLELENLRTDLHTLRNTLHTRQAELDKKQQELSAKIAETESRRRRIAHELKAQHAANLKEVELGRIELKQAAKTDHSDHSELQRQLQALQEECRRLKSKAPVAENIVDKREIERIEAEKKALAVSLADLAQQLAEARLQLADAQAQSGKTDEDGDDIVRRYELALDEVNDLKARNEGLQEQLTRARQSGNGKDGKGTAGILDWEAEKQRILAALEADFDEDKKEEHEEKLKIQDVVHKTDRILAEKDREIGDLRKLLESQTNNIGSMAVGAAALGSILDTDAIIKEERNNLARLQDECRDKLRQAEVEISLERAKIARERSQLDEKRRALNQQGIDLSAAEDKNPAKPIRGRWLARLGLSDTENEHGK